MPHDIDIAPFSRYGFEISPLERDLFSHLLHLFMEYNSHTNLSAIRDEAGIIEKHFIDSLFGASIIEELITLQYEKLSEKDDMDGPIRVLDIGSGGGFPGIPLKIVMPMLSMTLLDSIGKKVRAMDHFIEGLGLTQIVAIQERAEKLGKDPGHAGKYDFVVSRATAYMTDILTWSLPFLKPHGKIILYKMPSEDERRDMDVILKKLGLAYEGEFPYILAEKERILYIFGKKSH